MTSRTPPVGSPTSPARRGIRCTCVCEMVRPAVAPQFMPVLKPVTLLCRCSTFLRRSSTPLRLLDLFDQLVDRNGLLQVGDGPELLGLSQQQLVLGPAHEDQREREAHRGKTVR